jgi:membrane protease YdiL (CAAX protease family)
MMAPHESVVSGRWPAWGWEDVALLMGAVLPSLLLGLALMRTLRWMAPGLFGVAAVATLTYQLFVYAFLIGALFLLISWKYGQSFWKALGFAMAFRGATASVLAGPALAVSVSFLGVLLRAPDVRDPIREMITGRTTLAVVIVFGVLIAPFMEELLFRGFLLPVIARSVGPWLAIVLTAVLFALPHGVQNEWAWQQLTLIALAGVAFGFARVRTGATSASFLMHASFNATQFLGFLLTR